MDILFVVVDWHGNRSPELRDLSMKAETMEQGLWGLLPTPHYTGLANMLQAAQKEEKSLVIFFANNLSQLQPAQVSRPQAFAVSALPMPKLEAEHPEKELSWQERCYAAAPTVGDGVYRSLMEQGMSEVQARLELSKRGLCRSEMYV